MTIIVTKAFDISIPREDAATYVKVVYGGGCKHEKTFYTGAVVDYPGIDALNPMVSGEASFGDCRRRQTTKN